MFICLFYHGVFVDTEHNVVYACTVDMEDNLVRISDGGFNRDEYIQEPSKYASTFSQKVRLF